MLDRILEMSPAKINLFFKFVSKRKDGYHDIRSSVTLINLYDEILAEKSSLFEVKYIGKFAPKNNKFKDCIIEKLFKQINVDRPKYKFIIKKKYSCSVRTWISIFKCSFSSSYIRKA